MLAAATGIGEPYGGYIVENRDDDEEDTIYPQRGAADVGSLAGKEEQQTEVAEGGTRQRWQYRAQDAYKATYEGEDDKEGFHFLN